MAEKEIQYEKKMPNGDILKKSVTAGRKDGPMPKKGRLSAFLKDSPKGKNKRGRRNGKIIAVSKDGNAPAEMSAFGPRDGSGPCSGTPDCPMS